MNKLAIILTTIALLLSACTNQPGQTAQITAEPDRATIEVTVPPVVQATAEPTIPPTSMLEPTLPAPAAAVVVYKLVPGESTATYEVGETFFNQNNRFAIAIGKTAQITGDVEVDASNPANSKIGKIEIDVSQLKSDSSRRDNAIRGRFLESNRFPTAVFVPTSFEGLPSSFTPGTPLSFKVTGDLTLKEATKQVTFDVTANIENDALVGTATTTILLSDFGVGPIDLGGILKTEDQAKLTLTFVARP